MQASQLSGKGSRSIVSITARIRHGVSPFSDATSAAKKSVKNMEGANNIRKIFCEMLDWIFARVHSPPASFKFAAAR